MNRVLTSGCVAMVAWAAGAACSSSSQSPASVGDAADAGGQSDSGLLPITEVNGDAAGMTVVCGGTTCTVPSNGLVPLSPCCLPDDGCGATFGSGLAMLTDAAGASSSCVNTAMGTPDTACPSQSVMGMMLAGCCAVSGMCGLDLSAAGLGCNPLSALASVPLGADSAAPQPCSATGDAGQGGGDSASDSNAD